MKNHNFWQTFSAGGARYCNFTVQFLLMYINISVKTTYVNLLPLKSFDSAVKFNFSTAALTNCCLI